MSSERSDRTDSEYIISTFVGIWTLYTSFLPNDLLDFSGFGNSPKSAIP